MGQRFSCIPKDEQGLFTAIKVGDLDTVEAILRRDSSLIHSTAYDCNSSLHIAAANGRIEVLSFILGQSVKPDLLNRHKQTPLMLAAMHGKVSCVNKLIQSGANILIFDSDYGRTCLHYAAYHGHSDCVEAILSAAQTSQVSASWGYSRFVNVRDHKGATPLHLASRQGRSECVHTLLANGALVCASTDGYGHIGSTPLHLAARSGSLDCIRELLAWGANRLQCDASGIIPYEVALRKNHGACAALLNPSYAEPLVWPSPLKFMSELSHEVKDLLQRALLEANMERENAIFKRKPHSIPSPLDQSDCGNDNMSETSEADLCSICFDQACTVEIQECGHRMCAHCTVSLCCHNKPDPTNASPSIPLCPFCRSNIVKLVAAMVKAGNDKECDVSVTKPQKSWRSRNSSEGSSSFKGLAAVGSFRRLGRGSGRIAAENECLDKLPSLDS